ncbi:MULTISPECIES: GFA family protein [unclassified Mesorhizobium]|uniref:GFA family protein n=1 Tax=unclassified Mesorhizobium TaxID=325217 RepID=UPI0030150146
MVETSCHCGAIRLEVETAPVEVTDCNCSICRRYGALWAYYKAHQVRRVSPAGTTDIYKCNDRKNEFHRCASCGCVTHWAKDDRVGVNARLMAPEILARAKVRHLDGADTWKFLDE